MSDSLTIAERLRKRSVYGDTRLTYEHDPLSDEAANELDRQAAEIERLREALEESDWRSPHEDPGRCGASAIRVLVKIELRNNPPALNAPPEYTFGHRITRDDPPDHWPKDGWFISGKDDEYRVVAWRYIDPPDIARAALGEKDAEGKPTTWGEWERGQQEKERDLE